MDFNRCYGCMKPKTESPVCEHCGYDETASNASHQIPVGTVMQGKYLVGKVLGQGGFGITYLGWDLFLELPVAIKEYFPSGVVMRDSSHSLSVSCSAGDAGGRFQHNRERFLREAKSLARFEGCPEIVRVTNYFLENNTAYIVMEYVEGITLKQYVKNHGGKLSAEETFRLLQPVMQALDKIHATGLIHRDISPDNIMLLPDGGTKLIDFGAVRDVHNADVDQPLTKSTEAILKQGYAPIEQYQKRGALGPWTDVYALCATIYYCLTGEVPMDAPERVLSDEEFTWNDIPGLTAQQKEALEAGMALLPKDRTQSMKALHGDLFRPAPQPLAPVPVPDPEPEPEPAPEPQPRPRPAPSPIRFWRPVGIIVLLLAAIGIGIALFARGKDMTEEAPQLQETTSAIQPAETETPAETAPAETVKAEEPWEKNVMKSLATWKGVYTYLFDSDISTKNVVSVTFLDSVETAPSTSWDVSTAGDGSVLAWVSGFDGKYDLYIAADGGINGKEACESMFWYFSSLTQVNFNGCFHTEQTTDMSSMFASCTSLTELDLSSLDTSNVTDMSNMFSFCSSLEEIDLNCLDTSNVLNMSGMLSWCRSLKKVGLETWDTSKVETMSGMFARCITLEEIDLSTFDTSSVIYMGAMFNECYMLQKVNLSGFDTSNVVSMTEMFYGCTRLHDPDLSHFDTSKVAFYDNFMGDGKKVNGKVWNDMFDPAVTATRWKYNVLMDDRDKDTLFDSVIKKSEIVSVTFYDESNGSSYTQDNSGLGDMSQKGDYSVYGWVRRVGQNAFELYISANGGVNGKLAAEGLFEGYTNLQVVRFNGAFHTDEATSLRNMFAGCEKLSTVDFSGFNTENVTDMSGMFSGCKSLKNPNLSSFDTSKVTAYENFMDAGATANGQSWETMFSGSAAAAKSAASSGWEKNVLKDFTHESPTEISGVICDSDIPASKIASVTFLDSLESAPSVSWDVSEAGDGSVRLWVSEVGHMYDMYIAAEGGINGKIACKEMFSGYSNLKEINFNGNLHTQQATDFSDMFCGCGKLDSLDLSQLDTSNAVNMSEMFYGLSLEELDFSTLDTSKVTNMAWMFGSSNWKQLDLSMLDTSNVTNMTCMFAGCIYLKELDLSSFDTSKVTDMSYMFCDCHQLETVNLSSFDTSKVTDMNHMFYDCHVLNNPDLSSFDTRNVGDYELFMSKAKKVNGQPWAYLFSQDKRTATSNSWEGNVLKDFTDFSYGHQYTEAIADSDIEVTKIVTATFLDTLEDAPVTSWDVSEAGDGSVRAWVNGDGVQYDLYIAAEGGVNGKNACKELFNGYRNLKSVNFGGNLHTEQTTDFSCMFADCRSLESLDISTLDTSSATNMYAMFNNCRSMKTLDLSSMDTSKVTDMSSMFSVSGWESLDLSGFDTSSATSMKGMFSYCEGLKQLDLSSFDTSNVTSMEHMFYHCVNLKTLDVSSFDTSNVTDMTGMFRECSSIKDFDLSNFDVSNVSKYEFFMEQGKTVNGQPWAYLFSN